MVLRKSEAYNSCNNEKVWNDNAELWIEVTENGFDVYRDHINTPRFIKMLPDIRGRYGLDVGCGTGYNTRLLAQKGSRMVGTDISGSLIHFSQQKEMQDPLNIEYIKCDAINLPFMNESFDFICSFQCLMDIQEYEKALAEIYRVLKKNGFLQFSIPHPCFWSTELEWVYDGHGEKRGVVCADYFSSLEQGVVKWMFEGVNKDTLPEKKLFQTITFRRSLTDWTKAIVQSGFLIEALEEPRPSEEVIEKFPDWKGCKIVPYSLIFRCRK